jgi:hypothetical protein
VIQVFFLRQLQGKLESCTAELVETQAKLQRAVADAAMSAMYVEETEEANDGLLQRIAQVQIYSALGISTSAGAGLVRNATRGPTSDFIICKATFGRPIFLCSALSLTLVWSCAAGGADQAANPRPT